jgi:O-antigen ligase
MSVRISLPMFRTQFEFARRPNRRAMSRTPCSMIERKRLLNRLKIARPSFAAVDEWATGYLVTLPAFAGSLLSVGYFFAAIQAAFSLAFQRFPFSIPAPSRPFVLACWIYCAAMAFSSVVNHDDFKGCLETFTKTAAFLAAPLIIARYSFSDPLRSLKALLDYAPLGALLGLAVAAEQAVFGSGIATGGAGNASVFGAAMAWLGAISLFNCAEANWRKQLFALAGFVAGMTGIVLSQTRTLYPAALVLPLLFLILTKGRTSRQIFVFAAAATAAAALVAFVLRGRILSGFAAAQTDIEMIEIGRLNSSLGLRYSLWRSAITAFLERPLFGHGAAGKMAAVQAHLSDELSYVAFTHVHNALLDTAVAAGIFGAAAFLFLLASPFFMVSAKRSGAPDQSCRYIVYSVTFISMLGGATGALFTHDLLTVMYLLPMTLVGAAARGGKQNSAANEDLDALRRQEESTRKRRLPPPADLPKNIALRRAAKAVPFALAEPS